MSSGNGEKKGLMARIAKWAGISTALAGILTPWLFILDLQSKADDHGKTIDAQEQSIDAIVEAHGVKLGELNTVATEFVPWAANYDQWRTTVDKYADLVSSENRTLRDKVNRLEGYILASSNGRYNPRAPASVDARPPPPKPSERRVEQRVMRIELPSAPVIRDVLKAKRYRDHRKAKKCKPNDPRCGADVK